MTYDVVSSLETIKPPLREAEVNVRVHLGHELVSSNSKPVLLQLRAFLTQLFELGREFLLHVRPERPTSASPNSLATFPAPLNFVLAVDPSVEGRLGDSEFLTGFVLVVAAFVVEFQDVKFFFPGVRKPPVWKNRVVDKVWYGSGFDLHAVGTTAGDRVVLGRLDGLSCSCSGTG